MKYEEVLKIFDTLPAEVQIQSSLFTSDKWSPSKPKSPAETAFQGLLYSSRSGDCDFTAIDEQINRALQRSRETVAKYGKSRNPEQV
jgi:hypothetical protein